MTKRFLTIWHVPYDCLTTYQKNALQICLQSGSHTKASKDVVVAVTWKQCCFIKVEIRGKTTTSTRKLGAVWSSLKSICFENSAFTILSAEGPCFHKLKKRGFKNEWILIMAKKCETFYIFYGYPHIASLCRAWVRNLELRVPLVT